MPLAFTHFELKQRSLAVNHQGQFPAGNALVQPRARSLLGDATKAIQTRPDRKSECPPAFTPLSGHGRGIPEFALKRALADPGGIITVYIVLGVLYESYIHPITILSTLPSAGVGAILALRSAINDLGVVALIGIILLIGIVKKNAIMMIDFALEAEREEDKPPEEAIFQACLLRFRPIMMTTMAALLGGLPLALGSGTGSELRHPLGITIVGGLIVSQLLTLYTTPVVYLWFDRLAQRSIARLAANRSTRERAPADGGLTMNISAPFIRRPIGNIVADSWRSCCGSAGLHFSCRLRRCRRSSFP